MNIDLKWGGYYVSKENDSGEYDLFRLLDLNRDSYHIAMYKERFADIPDLDVFKKLSPLIWHVPMDTKGLLRKARIELIGGKALTEDDLSGYTYYLEEHGVDPTRIDELKSRLIEFSEKPPMKLRLSLSGEALQVEVID